MSIMHDRFHGHLVPSPPYNVDGNLGNIQKLCGRVGGGGGGTLERPLCWKLS